MAIYSSRHLIRFLTLFFACQGVSLLAVDDGSGTTSDGGMFLEAIVGLPYEHTIAPPPGITDIQIAQLPDGIHWGAENRSLYGNPTTAGEYQSTMSFVENGTAQTMIIFFSVHPEGTSPDDLGGSGHEPVRIYGNVGDSYGRLHTQSKTKRYLFLHHTFRTLSSFHL